MPKSKTAPILVILAGIIVAGSVAVYMSREGSSDSVAVAPASVQGRIRGAADAKVTLVEYGDYQCPACASYHPIVMELLNRYAGKLKLEYHHFPLVQIHPNAMDASIAAEAAGDQGKFWEMHDLLFERQTEWSNLPNEQAQRVFLQYALLLGLDANKFQQATRSPPARDRVLTDVRAGNPIVKGTPTFVLDGQVVTRSTPTLQFFVDYIETKLASPAQSSK